MESNYICKTWKITDEEYAKLDSKWGLLCEYQSWQLFNKNARTNHTDEQTDISQDIRIALMKAGSYYKRQVYVEKCLDLCKRHIEDEFVYRIWENLFFLWKNKTRHGANRQKFGPYQERLLDRLVRKCVPANQRPRKKAELEMDSKFTTYCKSITWNQVKAMGKKITREKGIRANQVSISEHEFLL